MNNPQSRAPVEFMDKLFNHYKLSPKSLSKISGITERNILNYENDVVDLTLENELKLNTLIVLLTQSVDAHSEDERVQLLILDLMQEFDLSLETIGIYAKLPTNEIEDFLENCESLAMDKRYRLGITVLFLHFICYTKHQRSRQDNGEFTTNLYIDRNERE